MDEEVTRLREQISTEHSENVERLTRIESGVGHFAEKFNELKDKLFGDGQPGLLQVMDGRISTLEKWMWRMAGAISLGIVVIDFLFHVYESSGRGK